MLKIQNFISQQNKSTLQWVSTGVLIFGLGCIAQTLYKNITLNRVNAKTSESLRISKIQNETPSRQRLNTKITQYSQFYFDKDMEIQNIQALMPQNPSVEDIYLNSPLIARDQYIRYTYQIRKRRRLIRKINQDQYINTIITYQNEVQDLLIRSRAELLEELGMDVQNFQNMEQNYEAIEDLRVLHRKAEQILKSKLLTDTKVKKMSKQKLEQILQQELYFMKNKMYDRIKQKLQKQLNINQNEMLIIVQTLVQDIIYQKYGYQKEDIVRKIQQINLNINQIIEAREVMEKNISDFNFDSLESLQDLEDHHQQDRDPNIKQSAITLHKSDDDPVDN